MKNNKLFSVIIICYRKFEFIYQAIESILKQSYADIELIISDDGSDNFPEEKILDYIDQNKKENIKNIYIHREKENCGTVKHLNNAIPCANGEYIMILAADDVLFDSKVLDKFVMGFEKAPQDCYIEMAQAGMYDYRLENLDYYYLLPNVRNVLESKNKSLELYNLMAYMPYLPTTSTCYRRKFFEQYGKFDERYKLVEDFPMHLRISRDMWPIHYENFVAAKHRDGGISHGSINGISKSNYWFMCDLLRTRKDEKKHYNLLNPDVKEKVMFFAKSERIRLEPQIWEYEKRPKVLRFLCRPMIYTFGVCRRYIDKIIRISKGVLTFTAFIWISKPVLREAFQIDCFNAQDDKAFAVIIKCMLIVYIAAIFGRKLLKYEDFPQNLAC